MGGGQEVSAIFQSNLIGIVRVDSRLHCIYLKVDYLKKNLCKVNERVQ